MKAARRLGAQRHCPSPRTQKYCHGTKYSVFTASCVDVIKGLVSVTERRRHLGSALQTLSPCSWKELTRNRNPEPPTCMCEAVLRGSRNGKRLVHSHAADYQATSFLRDGSFGTAILQALPLSFEIESYGFGLFIQRGSRQSQPLRFYRYDIIEPPPSQNHTAQMRQYIQYPHRSMAI